MKVNFAALSAIYSTANAVGYYMDTDAGAYNQKIADIINDIAGVRALCSCGFTGHPRELFADKKIYDRLAHRNHAQMPAPLRLLLAAIIELMQEYNFV